MEYKLQEIKRTSILTNKYFRYSVLTICIISEIYFVLKAIAISGLETNVLLFMITIFLAYNIFVRSNYVFFV